MIRKITLYHFITFLLIFTVFFSNNSIEIFAQPQEGITQNAEGTTETTTEAPSVIKNNAESGKTININSRAAILMDANTGMIIYEKNAHEKHYPASITKVLTGYIACSEGNMEDTLTVSQNAIDGMGQGGSSIGLVPGEQVSFEDGLYGVMLESANEVCMAIAEHMSGSVDAFVAKMNETAKSLGCNESNFANPHGFHNDNHYTTCYDMALITKKAVTNEDFNQIWGSPSHQIPKTNKNVARYLNHKDKMVKPTSDYYYPNLIGGKTGFTDEAGNTLVSYAEKDGASLICVVMKADGYDNTYKDSTNLLNYGFSVYNSRQTIFKATENTVIKNVVQKYNGKTYKLGTVAIGGSRDCDMALPKFVDTSKISFKYEVAEDIEAPININNVVGKVNIYYDETLLDSMDAVAVTNAPALSDKQLAKRALKENLRKYVMVPLIILIILTMAFLVALFVQTVASAIRGEKRGSKKRRRKKGRKRRPTSQHPDKRKQGHKKGKGKRRKRPHNSDMLR